ncbi:hypothetical protein [Rhizobium sullae]|uniref:hypothetical protein n=1 Tax=Rhizobium sullae TaxID=50338 RepID=UPI000B35A279|nr:hypothetical protein [Rhizobium sullae]
MNILVCILRFLAHVRRAVQQIYTVQYLRGIAAVAVLFFHVSERHDLGFSVAIGSLCIICLSSLLLDWPYLRALTSPVILEFAAGLLIGRVFVRGPNCPTWLA